MNETHHHLMDEYVRELRIQGKSTNNPRMTLSLFFAYCEREEIDVQMMTITRAENFQAELAAEVNSEGNGRYGRRSIASLLGNVSSFYAYLRRKKIVHVNPFREMTKMRCEKKLPRHVPSEKEMETLLGYFRDFLKGEHSLERRRRYKMHVLCEMLYATGCRIHEAATLTVGDVDCERGVVKVHDLKNKKERCALLTDYAAKVLRVYIDRMREEVNFGKNGGDMRLLFGARWELANMLNTILKKAEQRVRESDTSGVPLRGYGWTSHIFRHALGSHLLRKGCDIRYIQEILGHESICTTQIYTKVEKEDLLHVIDEYHPRGKL